MTPLPPLRGPATKTGAQVLPVPGALSLNSAGGASVVASGFFSPLDILAGPIGTGAFSVMPSLRERNQDQPCHDDAPLSRSISEGRSVVGLGCGHSIHSYSIIQPEQRNHG